MSETKRISITLPTEVIDVIEASVARGESRSVSAYVVERLWAGTAVDAPQAELEDSYASAWDEAESHDAALWDPANADGPADVPRTRR